ncbi:MAG TPA: hypothetical protein VF212_09455 [Longimicrobiales bacterium]
MITRAYALSAALVLLAAAAAHAQDAEFERVLASASQSWSRGDADAIAALATRGGLFINVGSRSFGPLGARHASALLREIFDSLGTARLIRRSVQFIGGVQPRGYGEFVWRTEGAQQATVFLGLVRGPDGWRLTEIRVSVPGW